MIVADTGAIIALVDADDRHHAALRSLFEAKPEPWVLPWAILPEVDYLLATHVGVRAQRAFFGDIASGAFDVEWGAVADLRRAQELDARYDKFKLGLVDAVVIAVAERLGARAIATIDLKHFSAVTIRGKPLLIPRDG